MSLRSEEKYPTPPTYDDPNLTINRKEMHLGKFDQCASRERLEYIVRRHAERLSSEAEKLYNLAKAIELLPNELEGLLYPFIVDSLRNGNRL